MRSTWTEQEAEQVGKEEQVEEEEWDGRMTLLVTMRLAISLIEADAITK